MERFFGLISAPAYALQRSRIGFLRLHIAAILLCLSGAVYLGYRGWLNGFTLTYAVLIPLCLLVVALWLWADARHYVVFRERPATALGAVADLAAEKKLFLRGSGFFEVSNMCRYLVEVPVVFWTTQLSEHILAAKVRAFNLLGLAGVPAVERGWWYIFLEPVHVIEIVPGDLCFGFRSHPAVRVTYETQKGRGVLYLSCEGPGQQAVLLKELQTKAEAARRAKNQSGSCQKLGR